MSGALRFDTEEQYLAWCQQKKIAPQPLKKRSPEPAIREPQQKELKWKNKRCEADGIWFDSMAERDRYLTLKQMEQAGLIECLQPHKSYLFTINGIKLWSYTPDFEYVDCKTKQLVIEDVKNSVNATERSFKRNVKMMMALYGLNVKVVTR